MATSSRSGGTVDADELGRREFTRNRKGWDPVEVRAHLLSMADEIKRLQTSEAGLRNELAALRSTEPETEELDESRLTRLLGEETARVLEAARLAATEIRAKGEESAARLVREAQEQATRITREAEELRVAAARESDELMAAARTTADELLSDAREMVETRRAEAEAEATAVRERAAKAADELRSNAEADAERLRSGAEAAKTEADEYAVRIRRDADDHADSVRAAAEALASELRLEAERASERTRAEGAETARVRIEEAERSAEAQVEAAREQGRAMVQEARDARERMLRDLAERRKVARQQLEALRAGRERLLDAFHSVRAAFDDATGELTDALPAAREAADSAARAVDDDIDEVVRELDAAIEATPDTEPIAHVAEPHEADGDAEPIEADLASAEITVLETGDEASPPDEPTHDQATNDRATHDQAAERPDSFHPAEGGDESSGSRLRLVPGGGSDADTDDDELELDGDDDDDDDAEGADASVEEIFARLRAGQGDDEDADGADGPDGPDAVIISLESERVEVAIPADPTLELVGGPSETPAESGSGGLLDKRDEVLAPIERAVVRKLKRALSDQENSVLHTVRDKRKSRDLSELLGDAGARATAIADLAVAELAAAVAAGAAFFDDEQHAGNVDAAAVAADLAPRVGEWLSDPLREQLERLVSENGAPAERDELAELLRAAYREWKGERLTEAGADLVTLAFNRGILDSATGGATHCWLVDHGGLPCSDAEDNHLAGAIAAGDEFPTGDRLPPAHPGCRCLLAPPPG